MTLTAGKYHKLLLVGFCPKEWKSHEVIYSLEFSFILVWNSLKTAGQNRSGEESESTCGQGSEEKSLGQTLTFNISDEYIYMHTMF